MRLLLGWLFNAVALLITAYLVPGIHVSGFSTALVAAIILGVVNTLIRPVLLLLTAPINLLTLGLFTFVVNAVLLMLVSGIVPGMAIDSFMWALLAAVVLSFVSTVLSHLLQDLGKIKK